MYNISREAATSIEDIWDKKSKTTKKKKSREGKHYKKKAQ